MQATVENGRDGGPAIFQPAFDIPNILISQKVFKVPQLIADLDAEEGDEAILGQERLFINKQVVFKL